MKKIILTDMKLERILPDHPRYPDNIPAHLKGVDWWIFTVTTSAGLPFECTCASPAGNELTPDAANSILQAFGAAVRRLEKMPEAAE